MSLRTFCYCDCAGHDFLFQQHRAAWRNISNMGRVEVQGDLVVAKLVNLAQFYLTTNFPSLYPYQSIPYQVIITP
jgi:trehalose/maltose hydrolase-like predicted phosphorylase